MARVDSKEADILEAFRSRLQTQLSLNARQCFLTVSPLAVAIPKGGDFYFSVAPGAGQFDNAQSEGGMCVEGSLVRVTIYQRMKLDPADHDNALLRDSTRGLLVLKQKVVKALHNVDLTLDSGDTFGRQHIWADHADESDYDKEKEVGWLTIYFSISWDWDLT